MTRNYEWRVGVILQRNPGPAHGRACPGGTSVHKGLHTSFTYDFDSRQNDTLMRSTPIQGGLKGRCRVRVVHTGGSSGSGGALGARGSIGFGRFSHFPVFWKRCFALALLVCPCSAMLRPLLPKLRIALGGCNTAQRSGGAAPLTSAPTVRD